MTKNTIIILVIAVVAFFVVPKTAWIWFGIGCLVAWNLMPQPAWIAVYFDKFETWLRGLRS